ncbi:MAG: thiamine phosphate synthase [Chromatiaceae bacterium]|nr:thiamine phosphate synthase [Chromatiaceae bacterium]
MSAPALPRALDLTLTLVERHAALGLPTQADPQALPREESPYGIAYAAARRLGFIRADAACLARAWHRQSVRTGHFDPGAWPAEPADFDMPTGGPRRLAFAPCPQALGLYAVLPSADWVGRMARAGVPTLQLRYKSGNASAPRAEIQAAVAAVQGTDSLLFINDHWREAIAAGAYGVHLGQEDLDNLSPADVAEIRDAGLRLGLSTHGYAEMLRADALGPSYLALGAVYPTTLKTMVTPPQGSARLGAYARLLRDRSLVAIGGIGAAQLPDIARAGVGSFAVVRAITGAELPEVAAATLRQAWEQATQRARHQSDH